MKGKEAGLVLLGRPGDGICRQGATRVGPGMDCGFLTANGAANPIPHSPGGKCGPRMSAKV